MLGTSPGEATAHDKSQDSVIIEEWRSWLRHLESAQTFDAAALSLKHLYRIYCHAGCLSAYGTGGFINDLHNFYKEFTAENSDILSLTISLDKARYQRFRL